MVRAADYAVQALLERVPEECVKEARSHGVGPLDNGTKVDGLRQESESSSASWVNTVRKFKKS